MERRKLKAVTSLVHSSDLTELYEELSYQRAKRIGEEARAEKAHAGQGEDR